MKATQQKEPKPFIPVVLTLETQEEVDALAGIFNHSVVSPGFDYTVLEPFASKSIHELHDILTDRIKAYYIK